MSDEDKSDDEDTNTMEALPDDLENPDKVHIEANEDPSPESSDESDDE